MTSPGPEPRFLGRGPGRDQADLGQDLGPEPGIAHLVAGDGPRLELDRQDLSAPDDLESDDPVRLRADGDLDIVPGRDLAAVDAQDLVVRPEVRLRGRGAGIDVSYDGLLVLVFGGGHADAVDHGDEDDGQEDVHDRAHRHDQEPGPAALRHHVVGGELPARFEHPLAQELDVAAHGDQADAVVRIPLLDAEKAFSVPEGERLDPDADELGHEEVPELVDEDEDAEDDEEGGHGPEYRAHSRSFA